MSTKNECDNDEAANRLQLVPCKHIRLGMRPTEQDTNRDIAIIEVMYQIAIGERNDVPAELQHLDSLCVNIAGLSYERINMIACFIRHSAFAATQGPSFGISIKLSGPSSSNILPAQTLDWLEKTNVLLQAATENSDLRIRHCFTDISPGMDVFLAFLQAKLRHLTKIRVGTNIWNNSDNISGEVQFSWQSQDVSSSYQCPPDFFPLLLQVLVEQAQHVCFFWVHFCLEIYQTETAFQQVNDILPTLRFLQGLSLQGSGDLNGEGPFVDIVPVLQSASVLYSLQKIQLTTFSLRAAEAQDQESAPSLQRVLASVTDLELIDCAFPDRLGHFLTSLFDTEMLERLEIWTMETPIGDAVLDGCCHLLIGTEASRFKELKLRNCHFERGFLRKLCSVLRQTLCSLERLTLGEYGMSREGDSDNLLTDADVASFFGDLSTLTCIKELVFFYEITSLTTSHVLLDALKENMCLTSIDGIEFDLTGEKGKKSIERILNNNMEYYLERNRRDLCRLLEADDLSLVTLMDQLESCTTNSRLAEETSLSLVYFLVRAKHEVFIQPSFLHK